MSDSPSNLRSPVVAFDIEVTGLEWEEVDEATRHYLLSRYPDKEGVESVQHRLALVRGLGRVVAIAMWNLDTDSGAVLVHGSGNKWEDFSDVPGTKIWRGNERELLEEYWRLAEDWGTVVTYNGRSYDGPVLMTRSAMLVVLREDYIRTARAKGMIEKVIINRHALKNSLLPVITVIGMEFSFFMGGLVVTEQVFNLNGLGRLLVESVLNSDYNLIQALTMVIVTVFVFVNFIIDLSYAWLDPRIRYG